MKTSITTILWGKIHTLRDMQGVFAEAKTIGFDGVGLETRLLPIEAIHDPTLVKKALGKVGIENAGSYSTMKLSDISWASKAGTPLLWVVARGDWEFAAAARAVGDLASEAGKSGIDVAVHNHLGTRFETEAQMKKLLDQRKELHVCYDTAHAEACGFDQARFIGEYGHRIALVHLKDLRAKLPKAKVSITRDFVNAGEGVVDFPKVFGALKDANYKGSIMLETEALEGRDPGDVAREGYRLIQDAEREA